MTPSKDSFAKVGSMEIKGESESATLLGPIIEAIITT